MTESILRHLKLRNHPKFGVSGRFRIDVTILQQVYTCLERAWIVSILCIF